MVFHRGRLRQNIRRDGCCRGGSAAGISVYIEVNLSAFPSAFGRARTQLPYRGEPFLHEAPGRALWGASIPVISVAVMTTEEKTTLPAQGSRRVQDEEETYPGEENTLRREVHGGGPLPHHTGGARSQAGKENKAQQRAAEEAERPALTPVEGTESQRKLYRAGILSDPDLHRHLFAGEHGAGPAGSAQLPPASEGCHRKAVRPGRRAAGERAGATTTTC